MNPLGLLTVIYIYLRCSGDRKDQVTADNMDDLAGGLWGCLESACLFLSLGLILVGLLAWGPVGWLILIAIGVLIYRANRPHA